MNASQDQICKMPFVQDNGIYFNVNFIQYYPQEIHPQALPPSYVMAAAIATASMPPFVVDRIVEIQATLGVSRTLFGLRFEDGILSLEFYFYHPKKFEKHTFEHLKKLFNPYMKTPFEKETLEDGYFLISYNLQNETIDGLNVYYMQLDPSLPTEEFEDTGIMVNPVIAGIGISYYFKPEQPLLERRNTYYGYTNCVRDFYEVMEQIYACCLNLFPEENPRNANKFLALPYLYERDKYTRYIHPYCLAQKEDAMGLYFLSLSINQYIIFLKYHEYPAAFIEAIELEKDKLAHIKFDVGLDFYLRNGEFIIKKTSYFGSF